MPLTRRYASAAVVVLALLASGAARAQEPTTSAECASAYEESQVSRKAGQLKSARLGLRVCASEACPEFIRNDCSTWYEDVQREMPTVVFAARSRGRDLVDVQISLAGEPLATRIDGQAIELDPGQHDFAFAAAGMQPLTQRSVIVRGERNRLIEVELVPVEAPRRGRAPAVRKDVGGVQPRSLLAPGIFVGVGAVGVATFAVMAAAGSAAEARLNDTCSPSCTSEQIAGVRAQYLAADISLGVGIASLGVGAYLFFSQTGPNVAHAPALGLETSANGAALTYGGAF